MSTSNPFPEVRIFSEDDKRTTEVSQIIPHKQSNCRSCSDGFPINLHVPRRLSDLLRFISILSPCHKGKPCFYNACVSITHSKDAHCKLGKFTTVFVDTLLSKKKKTAETFPKFPSIMRVIDRSDRDPPITATSVTFWSSLRHAIGLWLVDFDPICR